MSIIQRFITQVEITLHDLLDRKELKNPIGTLNLYVRQAEKETLKVKELIKRQSDLLEKLRSDLPAVEKKLAERNNQLQLAKEAADDQLIEFATQEVNSLQLRLQVLKETELEVANQYIELEQNFEQMKHQLEYMKLRQLQLMSQENSAHAMEYMKNVNDKQAREYGTNVQEASAFIENINTNKEVIDGTTLEKRLIALETK